jgi:superfamily I DNA and/or RNA helicase
LEEIDKQITILKRVVELFDRKKKLDVARQSIGVISQLKTLTENVEESECQVSGIKKSKRAIEIDIRNTEVDLRQFEEKKRQLERKINSIGTRIKKFFSKAEMRSERELIETEIHIREKSKEIELAHYSLSEIDTDLEKKEQVLREQSSMANQFIVNYKGLFAGDKVFSPIVGMLSVSNWEKIKDQLLAEVAREENRMKVDEPMDEYKMSPTYEEAALKLTAYQQMRLQLSRSSTEERIKSVSVIACTLDGYIGRNVDEKLNVDHIFLDEAGYANIIKALTLFNHKVPITFLGDHKQLPPVCEINELSIKRDDNYKNMFLWSQSAIYLERLFSKSRDEVLREFYQNLPLTADAFIQTTLNSTYRFGSNLAEVLKKHAYGDIKFNSCCQNGETKINYIHAPKMKGSQNRVSSNEAIIIQRIVNQLKQNGEVDFVILTPYTNQVKTLGDLLPQERNDLKILTVHGSQGREWNIVVFSVVDTYDKWFVDSTNLLSKGLNLINTAVSRAKQQLIIVCDKNYWIAQNGQLITDLIKVGEELTVD